MAKFLFGRGPKSMESVGPLCHKKLSALNAPFSPRRGSVMIRWCPDWQTAVAWLVVTAIASVIYFGPMTRVLDFGH
jgi:hypothetical protein